MFSLFLDRPQGDRDFLIADLWEAGVAGIVETTTGLRAFFEEEAGREALQARFGGTLEAAEERDWVAESRDLLQPMLAGSRFYLVPEWRDDPAPEGRMRIRINSGLAFGTGAHETTRLCLEALEDLVRPGITVVDVGTGSGILAEAASRLGAARVIACDIDPQAVAVARANFDYAGLDIELFEGSIQGVETGVADLTIGNISPEWLGTLARDWERVTKPGGNVLLSGLEAEDLPRVRERLAAAGLAIQDIRAENEWRALVVRPAAGKMAGQ
jgi:ribosomal protein L11 methyltransferase